MRKKGLTLSTGRCFSCENEGKPQRKGRYTHQKKINERASNGGKSSVGEIFNVGYNAFPKLPHKIILCVISVNINL